VRVGYTGASRLSGVEQQEVKVWCLVAIAIASSAPATDCSIPLKDVCLIQARLSNEAQWKEDVEEIGYLTMCIRADERARYRIAQLVEKALEQQAVY
jgi:hypothetical protein